MKLKCHLINHLKSDIINKYKYSPNVIMAYPQAGLALCNRTIYSHLLCDRSFQGNNYPAMESMTFRLRRTGCFNWIADTLLPLQQHSQIWFQIHAESFCCHHLYMYAITEIYQSLVFTFLYISQLIYPLTSNVYLCIWFSDTIFHLLMITLAILLRRDIYSHCSGVVTISWITLAKSQRVR